MENAQTQHIKDHTPPQNIQLRHYLVGGELVPWEGGSSRITSPVFQGGKRTDLGQVPELGPQEALNALETATAYFNDSLSQPLTTRQTAMKAAVQEFNKELQKLREPIAQTLSWELGKTIEHAYYEFDRTVDYIANTLQEFDQTVGQTTTESHGINVSRQHHPDGVVLCYGPYNFPLNEAVCMIIPALLTGNAVIYKPAYQGILFWHYLLPVLRDCFPAGSIAVLFGGGSELGVPLMRTGQVQTLAYIGNSKGAQSLASEHPNPIVLKRVFGLEAKNPVVVMPGADVDKAVDECVKGALIFNGQRCTAFKMVFVHESLGPQFRNKLADEVDALSVGHPQENPTITPLPSPGKVEYLDNLVQNAVENGAAVLNKNAGPMDSTTFFPAVLYPVNPAMTVYHEEQFGPLVPVVSFEELAEVAVYLKESAYGQQASVYSTNKSELEEATNTLLPYVSRLNLNRVSQRGPDVLPFTGKKNSAVGTLGVIDALVAFTSESLIVE